MLNPTDCDDSEHFNAQDEQWAQSQAEISWISAFFGSLSQNHLFGCFKLKSSLYDFQDPKYKNILYATEGHLENVPCRVVSSDNHTQLKILGQNDLTKEPVSSEIVYIEMHIQLHSATRVQWKIVEQYDSRILENKMALGKP